VHKLKKSCGILLVILFVGMVGGGGVAVADTMEQNEQYLYAMGLIQRKLYDEASRVLVKLTASAEPFSRMDAAVFWLAESEYRRNEYVRSAGYYARLLKEYPSSEFFDRAAFGLGWAHIKDDNPKSAVEAFLRVGRRELPLWIDANLKAGYLMVRYGMDTDEMVRVYKGLLKEPSLAKEQQFEANLQIAIGRFNQVVYVDAIEYFKKAFALAPEDKKQIVSFFLAESHFRLKDYKAASPVYEQTIGLGADTEYGQKAAYSQAWCCIKNGDTKRAVELLKGQVAKADSVVHKESVKVLIDLYMNLHSYDPAIELVNKHGQKLDRAERIEAEFTKALALTRIGEFEQGIAAFDEFVGKYPKEKQVPEAYYQRGLVKVALSRFKEAIKDFELVLNGDGDAEFKEKATYRMGECWFNLGNVSQASLYFNQVIKKYPKGKTRFDALYQLGELAYIDGNYEDALIAFDAISVARNELSNQAVFRAGEVLMKAGRFEKAVASFEQYLTLEPNGSMKEDAYFKSGLSWLELKDDAKALTAFSELLNAKGYFRQEARFNIAEIAYRHENFALAIQHYKAILSEEPNNPLASQAKKSIGIALYKMGDYENSIKNLSAILKEYPATDVVIPEARLWLGKGLIATGQVEDGVLEALKVPVLYPKNKDVAEAYATAARGYKQVKNQEKMEMMYKEVLKHKPSAALKTEAEKELKIIAQ
jgi:TolA-binding protein